MNWRWIVEAPTTNVGFWGKIFKWILIDCFGLGFSLIIFVGFNFLDFMAIEHLTIYYTDLPGYQSRRAPLN